MTSYEFQVICKNALIEKLKEKYNEEFTIEELHLVWFSKILQNFKCVIVDLRDNQRYYEVSYNGNKNEIYVDIYEKQYNFLIKAGDFKKTVNKEG